MNWIFSLFNFWELKAKRIFFLLVAGTFLKSCATDGSGNGIITKLASREKANSIIADDDVNIQTRDLAYKLVDFSFNAYLDSFYIKNQIQLSSYDTAKNRHLYVVTNTYTNGEDIYRHYLSFAPATAAGAPFTSSVDLNRQDIRDSRRADITRNIYDTLTVHVQNFPYTSPVNDFALSMSGYFGRTYEYVPAGAAYRLELDELVEMNAISQSVYSSTVMGTGSINLDKQFSDPDVEDIQFKISVRVKAVITPSVDNYTSLYYMDFGGYGYTRSDTSIVWTAYNLDF